MRTEFITTMLLVILGLLAGIYDANSGSMPDSLKSTTFLNWNEMHDAAIFNIR